MAHPGITIAPPGPGKFRAWLNDALRRHRVWLWVNLAGMTIVSVIGAVAGHLDPDAECFPGPLGSSYDLLASLIIVLIWSGNTVALLVGLLRLRDNSLSKRLTLLALWLLTPVCWALFLMAAGYFTGPDCCQVGGMC